MQGTKQKQIELVYNKTINTGFAKGGKTMSETAIEKMFRYIDKDGSGTITFDEFAEYMKAKKRKRDKSMTQNKMYSTKKILQIPEI